MLNTVEAIKRGMPLWSAQGSQYLTTRDPRSRLLDENLELEHFYGGSISDETAFNNFEKRGRSDLNRLHGLDIKLDPEALKARKIITERVRHYGSD